MLNKELVGKIFPPYIFEVTKGKINELVQAIGDPNPIYRDPLIARAQGYRDIVAPPTFITLAGHWTGALNKILEEIGVEFSRVLHGEEVYEYMGEIYPGDILRGVTKLLTIEEKNSKLGNIELVRFETIYFNQHNEEVIRGETMAFVTNYSGGGKIEQ